MFKKNDQFTVNIALIKNRQPILGIIYLPVTKELFYNINNKAYKQFHNKIEEIHTSKNDQNVIVTSSLYNSCAQTKSFIDQLKPSKIINLSSAIKFCLLAEGKIDVYPRFNCTMEWDIAAGHAIINAAGGRLTDIYGEELLYAKKDFKNDGFIAYGY